MIVDFMIKGTKKIFSSDKSSNSLPVEPEMVLFRKRLRTMAACGLVIYWVSIFTLTHMPMIPRWVMMSGMSDKSMHFVAYFLLTFFFWNVVRPGQMVYWKRGISWLSLLFIAIYGVIDELLQNFVHRTPDVLDFAADMSGCLLSLIFLSVMGFWAASLLHGIVMIVVLNCFSTSNILGTSELVGVFFHFLAYGFIAYALSLSLKFRVYFQERRAIRYAVAFGGAAGVLLVMKLWDVHIGRSVEVQYILIAIGGILYSLAVSRFVAGWSKNCCRQNR